MSALPESSLDSRIDHRSHLSQFSALRSSQFSAPVGFSTGRHSHSKQPLASRLKPFSHLRGQCSKEGQESGSVMMEGSKMVYSLKLSPKASYHRKLDSTALRPSSDSHNPSYRPALHRSPCQNRNRSI